MLWKSALIAASGSGGFPAFDAWHWPSQIFWLCISFAVLYLFMSRVVLSSISDTLETRADRIQSDLDEAERLALKVAKLEESVDKTLQQARASAKSNEAEMKRELEAELAFAAAQREQAFAEKLEASTLSISAIEIEADGNVSAAAVDVAQAILAQFGATPGRVEVKSAVKTVLEKGR